MSQNKWYRGNEQFVICQASDGSGHLCFGPCRTTGTGLIGGAVSTLYECSAGHRFGLTDVREVRGAHRFGVRGELDAVSGESGTSHETPISGESGTSHEANRVFLHYTDYRKVTQIPRSKPEFGRP